MRAFLSVRDRDQGRCSVRSENDARGYAAVREAERILAVSEPPSRDAAHVSLDGLCEVWIAAAVDNNAHAALYEALAAFVEPEDGPPCPGCGSNPGDGRTAGCADPDGCGYFDQPDVCYACGGDADLRPATVDTSDAESGPGPDDFVDVVLCGACRQAGRI